MSRYTITTLCSVLWYMCVLLTWVQIGQKMQLFGDFSPKGWLMIVASFVASMALNFILNPLIWIVAACYIQEARKEGRKSRWQYYPSGIGIILLAALLGAFFKNVNVPGELADEVISSSSPAPAAPVRKHAVRAPKVSGIMLTDGARKALIDGFVLKEGEEHEGFLIDEISETSVTFISPDGERVVRRVK